MRHQSTWPLLAVIAILTIFSVMVVWPGYPKKYLPDFIDYPEGPILDIGSDAMRLGLDLKGGTYLLTEANLSVLPEGRDADEAMETVQDLMEERVNEFGVSETEVTREGPNRIAIQIPGIDPDEASQLIGRTALLQFSEVVRVGNDFALCTADDGGADISVSPTTLGVEPDDAVGNIVTCTAADGRTGKVQWQPAIAEYQGRTLALTGAQVRNARADINTQGNAIVLEFSGEGQELWSEITGRNVNAPIGIFLDEELLTAPQVSQQITSGETSISPIEELDDAKNIAKLINAGSLPVPLRTIQATEVDATLGDKTLVRGVQAGLIGILAVMAFMVLYYRLPGVLASVALFAYIVIVMMLFKLGPIIGPVTITLAGIAGFVLSVGMAVDANILVFERLKEELRAGRTLASAIEHGFDRAWSSIRDSNVSTLITCAILWWFGEQFNAALVKGFALTLAIGVSVSMFSSIVITRTLLRALVNTGLSRFHFLFVGDTTQASAVRRTSRGSLFDFIGRRWIYFAISAALLVPGLISLATPPSLKAGIEFSSGATLTVDFVDETIDQDAVRDALSAIGHEEARVQRTGEGNFIIRLDALDTPPSPPVGAGPPSERDELEAGLEEELGTFETLNFNQVSEIVSNEIVRQALLAVLFAAAAILVYITWSFRNVPKSYRYGIAAVIAALHDAVFVLGAFSIMGKLFDTEVDSLFITGILTVIGFSVHDTIVVFDRIRENVATNPGVRFGEIVNASLTETVARSINTSMSVIIALSALLMFSTGEINVLLITLLMGIVAGTYSSIFIASQILVAWEEGDLDPLIDRFAFWRDRDEVLPETV